jgi:hypothetical protein
LKFFYYEEIIMPTSESSTKLNKLPNGQTSVSDGDSSIDPSTPIIDWESGGKQEITTGYSDGTINVDGIDVAVKGLGSAAYTASSDYATSGHTHTTVITSDSGAASITLAHGSTYKLSAGGTEFIFKMPTPDEITAYSSIPEEIGGTNVSLVTTGEKYIWNNKSDLTIGTSATTAAAGDHTHDVSLAPDSDSDTVTVTLAHDTVYKLTAGGSSIVFKTPADNNTTYSSEAAELDGTDVSLVTTGEKYIWYNKSDLTLGTTEKTAAAGDHTHNYAGSNKAGGPANKLHGRYTGDGGQQDPSYFGKNVAGCLMSNVSINGDNSYKNWLYMDAYDGTDAGGTSAIGVSRTAAKAFIMQSSADRDSWAATAELLSTANWSTYCAASSHTHNYLSTSGGTVSGSLTVTGALKGGTVQSTSDIRKKSNIVAIGDVDLHSIKAYEYNLEDNKRRSTGLIAQEVEKILPTAVSTDDEGFLSLDYNAIVAVLVDKINRLEARVNELENK